MTIAIIPARGGSKRIPRKNIVDFLGQPMITYPLRAAILSDAFDRIWVSTDDAEIGAVAGLYGADMILRPPELADDYTGTQAVVKHALESLMAEGRVDPAAPVCCIYPTAVMLKGDDLTMAHQLLQESGKQYVFSVCRYHAAIQRALRMSPQGEITPVWPQFAQVRTQDLEPRFYDAGQFYFGWARAFLDGVPLFAPHSLGYEIPATRAVDIDWPEDLEIAKATYQAAHTKKEEGR